MYWVTQLFFNWVKYEWKFFNCHFDIKLFVKQEIVIIVKIGEYSLQYKNPFNLAICGKMTQNNEKLGQADSNW